MKFRALQAFLFVAYAFSWSTQSFVNDLGNYIGRTTPISPKCALYSIAIEAILKIYSSPGSSAGDLRQSAMEICVGLKLQTERVCKGLIDSNLEVIKFILDSQPKMSADRISGTIFQADNCGKIEEHLDWFVNISNANKTVLKIPTPQVTAEPLNVVHITDIHFDRNYVEGSNAVCGEPLCCHADQGPPKSEAEAAGKWGDYRSCDVPWHSVVDAFEQVQRQHKRIDYIYATGDIVEHQIHETSISSNNETIWSVFQEMRRVFGDVPIFPSVGNHEAHPVNAFAPTKLNHTEHSSAWLYKALADLWAQWLPAETRATILKGGYYTVLVRPGFRIVSLNSNQCYTFNWWILYDHVDPDDQLKWLVRVLEEAETNDERVHILTHVPSGDVYCYKTWSREYNRIVERFSETISAQFGGHTHYDQMQIYYSKADPAKAVNVLFSGGSVTPYEDVNPNYRVYSVDASTLNVLDLETWIFNMTSANMNPGENPDWYKLYSFRETYKVDSLSPTELDRLAYRMAMDNQLLQTYFRHYYLMASPKIDKGCDPDCAEKLLCELVRSDTSDDGQCEKIAAHYRAALLISTTPASI